MKSGGKRKKTRQHSSPRFSPSAAAWRVGDHAAQGRFRKKAAWPGRSPPPTPLPGGSSGPPSFSVPPPPQGRALEHHWVSTRGRPQGGGGAIPVIPGGLGSPPPLLLSLLGYQWPGLAARCPGPGARGTGRQRGSMSLLWGKLQASSRGAPPIASLRGKKKETRSRGKKMISQCEQTPSKVPPPSHVIFFCKGKKYIFVNTSLTQ